MSVLLLRHGALDLHAPRHLRPFVGAQDVPLSPRGVAQAQAWARRWGLTPEGEGVPLAGVVCSDLSRCVDTAHLIARGHGIAVHVDARLREICLGQWQGLTPQEVEARFPGQYAARGADLAHFRPQGGESFADVARRVLPAFDQWQRHFGALPWLLVGHAGVNRVILARHLALPLAHLLDIPQPYACCTCLTGEAPA